MDAAPDQPGPPAGPIRVALVDDHAMFVQGLERLLHDEPDIEVVARAGSVSEAGVTVAAAAPHVVVLDHQLPDGDGITLARALLAERSRRIVMLTASADVRVAADAIQAGCAGFLTKGRAVEELVVAVRVVASGEAYVPADLLSQLLPRLGEAPAHRAPTSPHGSGRCCASAPGGWPTRSSPRSWRSACTPSATTCSTS